LVLVSLDGVAPSRMVGVSASVNLPLHRKVQKFSSGTGSPGLSRKKRRKMVEVVFFHQFDREKNLWGISGRDLLSAQFPSCHPINSIKELKKSQGTDFNQRRSSPGLILSLPTTGLLKQRAPVPLCHLYDTSTVATLPMSLHLHVHVYYTLYRVSQKCTILFLQ